MVGGGSRREEGSLGIRSSNVFAALDSLRKKKKIHKSKGKDTSKSLPKDPEPQVFWQPTPLQSVSWADVEDDDDYYATVPPPKIIWDSSEKQESKENSLLPEEETESEDGDLDEGEEDIDDEAQLENDVPDNEPIIKKLVPTVVPKETERQLSKKELKKKELAELEAVLAEFRVSEPEQSQGEKHIGLPSVVEKDNGHTPLENKTSKKKKKKEKTSKEVAKNSQEQANGSDNFPNDALQAEDGNPSVDVKERLKKVSHLKKKKSNKEMDAAAKAAAAEAATRNAKLAAAKKKEKNHYNQQPLR